MAIFDKGINKAVDRFLKDFSDEAPPIFAYLMGAARRGAHVDIKPLRPETSPPAVYPDYVARVVVDSESPFVFHVEFQLVYKGEVPDKVTRRAASLMLQHNLPVITALLLLDEKRTPADVPDRGEICIPPTRITHEYRVLRAWQLDPAILYESGNIRLLPWALLMNVSDDEARRIVGVVEREGDEETRARVAVLAVTRYGKRKAESILGGFSMGLMDALMESEFFTELREENIAKGLATGLEKGLEKGLATGIEKGLAKGRVEGRVEAARRMLRVLIGNRYPVLSAMPEIDQIADPENVEGIIRSYDSATEQSLRQAILSAAGQR